MPASTTPVGPSGHKHDAAIELAIESTIEALIDHERYCGAYASKEEPHIHGLLQSLSESVKQLEEAQARQASEGEDVTALAKARSLLHRLISSTNRRMHKGFPEMLAYIMEKPEYIASMEFVPLYYSQVMISYICSVESAASSKLTYSMPDFSKRILRPGQVPFLDHVDYAFRSEKLQDFPLYFFISACEAQGGKWQKKTMLAWWEAADGGRHPRSSIKYSALLPAIPLFSPQQHGETTSPYLRDYAYYVALRTFKAWRCPELIGHIPPRLHEESTQRQKGEFALFVMLLLRPYRSFHKEVLEEAQKHILKERLSDADAHWTALYDSYLTWRRGIESIAMPLWQDGTSTPLAPGPPALPTAAESSASPSSTTRWWACAIYAKLRNFDLVVAKHTSRSSAVPTTVYGVPIVEENAHDASDEDEEPAATRENPHDGDALRQHDDLEEETDDHGEEVEGDVGGAPLRKGDAARQCGKLPMDPDLFLKTLIPVESRGPTPCEDLRRESFDAFN